MESESDPRLIDDQFFIYVSLRLDAVRREQLRKRLEAVLAEFKGGEGRSVVLTIVMSPDLDRE